MTATPTAFDPLAPEMCIDPYPHYAALRERDPVHRSALGLWILTRHADVAAFFTDKRLEHRYDASQAARVGADVAKQPYFGVFRRMVFVLDDPDHRRLRRLMSATFTPRRVQALRGRVEEIANRLLDPFAGTRQMDLVADFAKPFPTRVIGELLGVPEADQIRIGELADALNPVLEFLPMAPEVLGRANEAVLELAEYFRALAATKRAAPGDDLYSAMVEATDRDDDSGLDEDELIANVINLYVAGHETTAGATGLAVLALHRNPDQLAALKANSTLLPSAIVELLRYDSPGQATARVAIEDIQFGDTILPAGDGVVAYIGAANRDPTAYPNPDVLDVRRQVENLTTFGGGAHFCIGHALARQELVVALGSLLRRCPDLRLATLDPPFRPTPLMRGLEELRVSW